MAEIPKQLIYYYVKYLDWATVSPVGRPQTDGLLMAKQVDIVLVDKQRKEIIVKDAAIPSDSNIRKRDHE